MQAFANQLYLHMEEELVRIGQQPLALLQQLPQYIHTCQQALADLRDYFDKQTFADRKEEIQFFKVIKPRFYSQFIYYVSIFQVEVQRPSGSDKTIRKYLQGHLNRLTHFFDSNSDLYQYYRSGAAYLDEVYFVRGHQDMRLAPDDLTLVIDPIFCTLHSYKLSRLLANDQLRDWLNEMLNNVNTTSNPAPKIPEKKIQWTGSKVSLIELIYALQSSGVLNHSTADIKHLTEFFEIIFQIKLGNVYNTFNEMRIRKKNRSSFLDLLKDKLIQRMDEADEQ